jgi:hypothetical protein
MVGYCHKRISQTIGSLAGIIMAVFANIILNYPERLRAQNHHCVLVELVLACQTLTCNRNQIRSRNLRLLKTTPIQPRLSLNRVKYQASLPGVDGAAKEDFVYALSG